VIKFCSVVCSCTKPQLTLTTGWLGGICITMVDHVTHRPITVLQVMWVRQVTVKVNWSWCSRDFSRYNLHSAGSLFYFQWEILIYLWDKIYRSNFIKQHSDTVMDWNYQNADCSLRKKLLSFIMICSTLSFPLTFVCFVCVFSLNVTSTIIVFWCFEAEVAAVLQISVV